MPRRPTFPRSSGRENITAVQMATVMAAMINPIIPCTNRELLPKACSIMNLIERRVQNISPGAWRILALHCSVVTAEWAIDTGKLPRVDVWLLEQAARDIKATDVWTGLDWVIIDRSKKAWQQRDRNVRRFLRKAGIGRGNKQRQEKKAA